MTFNSTKWIKNPKIYEINTWPWLQYLSEIYNNSITLNNIPDEVFNHEIKYFDIVWLMGVWERSPASKKIALEHPDLQKEYHKALHDFKDEDVVGSPYSVFYYHVDNKLGGVDGIIKFRNELKEKGIHLILDYVPNHVSVDSLWTFDTNLFIEGSIEDLMEHPYDYFSLGEKVYAYGRDPNFPPWTDTIQINAFSEKARQKTIQTLVNIAELCDGVRCDMAMLLTNEIFSRTWGEKAGSPPEKEFWEEVIPAVRKNYPNLIFIAEVYWDMEWKLQQQGFNFCYDKRLYDRLVHGDVNKIKDHLNAEWKYQSRLIRFIENHDEMRAIEKFGEEKSKAAAIITLTLPGARLVYDGQTRGNRIKLPVQLGRIPFEETNNAIFKFYQDLLKAIPGREYREGSWSLCKSALVKSSDSSFTNIISYLWWNNDDFRLIVVNYSPDPSKAHIKVKPFHFDTNRWIFTDLLKQKSYIYNGNDLYKYGLYIELEAWEGQIFDIKKESN